MLNVFRGSGRGRRVFIGEVSFNLVLRALIPFRVDLFLEGKNNLYGFFSREV